MCPGCPHRRRVFYVLRKLRAAVAGDIGCYALGALPPFEPMDAFSSGVWRSALKEIAWQLTKTVVCGLCFELSGLPSKRNEKQTDRMHLVVARERAQKLGNPRVVNMIYWKFWSSTWGVSGGRWEEDIKDKKF